MMRKKSIIAGLFVALGLVLLVSGVLFSSGVPSEQAYDVVIKNATLFDGTGERPSKGNIGIRDGKIVEVGKLDRAKAEETIEAKGLYVAPGFIDLHTHVDRGMTYKEMRSCLNYLKQGVTTVVVGQCGRSAWPIFEKVEDQMDRWQKEGIGVNAALLVGHGQVRELVMGVEDREPTAEELARMKALVLQAMEGGAHGLSTGLGYVPGKYCETDELIELVRVIVPYGGVFHTHMRDEGDQLIEAVQETLEIAEKTGATTNISHLKASQKANWGKVTEACRMIEEARAKGLEITADQYPYPISSGNPYRSLIPAETWSGGDESASELSEAMSQVFGSLRDDTLIQLYELQTPFAPLSVHHQEYLADLSRNELVRIVAESFSGAVSRGADNNRERARFLKRMEDPAEAEKIRREITERIEGWVGAENIIVDITVEKELIGKSLEEVAAIKGVTVADAAIDLELQGAKVTPLQMSLEDVEYIMKKDYVALGSDGTAPFFGMGLVHPRSFGAFPTKIRKFAMERKVISLPFAIRSCTSLPAQVMGWEDRGLLKEGYWADIVVFDPKTYRPRSNFTNAHQYAEGVEYLLVNGEVVIDKGVWNGSLSGRVLELKGVSTTN